MTSQQLIEKIKLFPIDERVSIIEQISQSVLKEMKTKNESDGINSNKRKLSIDERIAIVENLSGSLREEGKFIPMTREEEREIYLEHLTEKYS